MRRTRGGGARRDRSRNPSEGRRSAPRDNNYLRNLGAPRHRDGIQGGEKSMTRGLVLAIDNRCPRRHYLPTQVPRNLVPAPGGYLWLSFFARFAPMIKDRMSLNMPSCSR